MDDNKICFITCVNNEILYAKCLDFLNRLIVPPDITVEYKALQEASSMCDGYNEAMTESDAKYKVYLHQDAYITYPYFIHRLINLFKERSIGLVGMIGSRTLPESCVWWESKDKYGWVIDTSDGFQREQKYLTCAKNKYEEVVAIDGMLMATQYDVPWRADLFDGWHFYDVAQCLEFRRAGYKIVVSVLPCSQVTHDCGIVNHTGYLKYRDILKAEYGEELLKINGKRISTMANDFSAHNVILDDGTYTVSSEAPPLPSRPWYKSAKRSLMLAFGNELAGRSIVDLGCLTGGYTLEFARLGMDALGIEARQSNFDNCIFVKNGVNLPTLRFAHDTVWNLEKYGKFDAVFCCGLFYHLDRPREFLRLMSSCCNKIILIQTHFSTIEAIEKFNLSPLMKHEGLPGRWFSDRQPGISIEKLEKMKWASWENATSFWVQREHLIEEIYNNGFDMVFEQYDCLAPDISESMTQGYYKTDNRCLFVGIRIGV